MANQIKMAERGTIVTLYGRGWSRRRIARELDLDRETVGRHIRLEKAGGSKPAIPPTGIHEALAANPANLLIGIGEAVEENESRNRKTELDRGAAMLSRLGGRGYQMREGTVTCGQCEA